MYTNETVLTPFFRYLLWCIEKDGEIDFKQARAEINALCQDGQDDSLAAISQGERSFLERTAQLLELKSQGNGVMRSFWEKEREVIEREPCKRCARCRKCQQYFWSELGELFFQEPNDMKRSGIYLPVRRLPEQMKKNLTPSKKAADLYYSNHCRKKPKIADGCIILKGMSSSTPSLMNSIYDTNRYSGGGFYLRHKGIGVAIDPGYHFLDNLHHYGLSVLDINVVVITHEHIDHNNDMRLLDDLHRAVYEYEEDAGKRKIKWYLDEVSYKIAKIYQESGTGFDEKANILYCVSPKEGGKQIELDEDGSFYLKCFATRHIEDETEEFGFKRHTFGCQFQFMEGTERRSLVYTSDTRYFSDLVNYIEMPDILIANISGVYEDDFMLVKPKKRHLGYYGCYYLLKDIYRRFCRLPGLVMLSEFWNGENDIRYDVASFLETQIRQECDDCPLRILPAEVGMSFRVMDGSVRCSQCGTFTRDFLVRKPNGYQEKIKIFCKSCVY